jgi:hypothetical protein
MLICRNKTFWISTALAISLSLGTSFASSHNKQKKDDGASTTSTTATTSMAANPNLPQLPAPTLPNIVLKRLDDNDPDLKNCIVLIKDGKSQDVTKLADKLRTKIDDFSMKNASACDIESAMQSDSDLRKTSRDITLAALVSLEIQTYVPAKSPPTTPVTPPSSKPVPGTGMPGAGPGKSGTCPDCGTSPYGGYGGIGSSGGLGLGMGGIAPLPATENATDPIYEFCQGTLTSLILDKAAVGKIISELAQVNNKPPKKETPEDVKKREDAFAADLNTLFDRKIQPISTYTYGTGDKLKGFEDLDVAEVNAIKGYTASEYVALNRGLRTPAEQGKYESYKEELNAALDKIPDYKGEVHRGATLPEDVLQLHQIGSIVTYSGFTSTSVAHGFGGAERIIIYSTHGKYIDAISSCHGEEEVLFKAGTKFKVLDRHQDTPGGEIDIIMEEVP